MKLVIAIFALFAAYSQQSAALGPLDKESILITSTPPGAAVKWNRQEICITPCNYRVGEYAFNGRKSSLFSKRLVQPVILHADLDGYQPKDLMITSQPRVWTSLNRRNQFVFYVIERQIFDFQLDKIAAKPKALTNADVVNLWNGGLGEGVIIDKINSNATDFSLEIDDLLKLRQIGIPDDVIQAMVKQSAPEKLK